MRQRGLNRQTVDEVLTSTKPFQYSHGGEAKSGYYDPVRKILVTVAGGVITTVMCDVAEDYVRRLQER